MSKLFKLKEWITPKEAAGHLAVILGEPVAEADIYRLAIEGVLKLSVQFINTVKGCPGQLTPIANAKFQDIDDLPSTDGHPLRVYEGPRVFTAGELTHILETEDEVVNLRGVFDLPMIGAERLDVEQKLQSLLGGPQVTMQSLDGPLVASGDVLYQLLESFDDNEYQVGSKAHLEALKARIFNGLVSKDEASKLLEKHKADREKFLENQQKKKAVNRFYPAGGLPSDAVFVVRPSALTEFLSALDDEIDDKKSEKSLNTRERDTLLRLVLGMAVDGYGFDPKAARSPVAKEISDCLATRGLEVSDDTVRKYLKEAVVKVWTDSK